MRELRPNIQHYDVEVVNYYINLFMTEIAPAFPTFEHFKVTQSTLPDLVLAIAAVGGLLCDLEGSLLISSAMYTDSRRLLCSRVRLCLPGLGMNFV